MKYPHLLAPGKIGSMTLKNRIVQGPAELQAAGFNGEMSDDYIVPGTLRIEPTLYLPMMVSSAASLTWKPG